MPPPDASLVTAAASRIDELFRREDEDVARDDRRDEEAQQASEGRDAPAGAQGALGAGHHRLDNS
jgi:hypothetical protein